MTEFVELQGRIDRGTRDLERSYREALNAVEKLKEKVNALELSISQKGCAETNGELDALNCAIESLNRLTDSLILRSERSWEEYRKLEHECKALAFKSAGLEDLRVLCKKTEELATNLLCYSLARFKRKVA